MMSHEGEEQARKKWKEHQHGRIAAGFGECANHGHRAYSRHLLCHMLHESAPDMIRPWCHWRVAMPRTLVQRQGTHTSSCPSWRQWRSGILALRHKGDKRTWIRVHALNAHLCYPLVCQPQFTRWQHSFGHRTVVCPRTASRRLCKLRSWPK